MKTKTQRPKLAIDRGIATPCLPTVATGTAIRQVRKAMHRIIVRDRRIGRTASGVIAAFSLATLLTACGSDTSVDPNLVSTDKGSVRGTSTPSMRSFKGIPYAAPPVGALRWTPPQPATSWTNLRDASDFANHCPQSDTGANESEDCLYLNVYTPVGSKGFPVMVWIHGGALVSGESDDFDPTKLVAQGVAVVTINYRLGALGWLTHPALSAQTSSGNYGLLDQQAAMRWVKTNIAAFGGDPGNVTVFGESAGGQSVMAQIASPLATGLFSKAIVQSGAFESTQPTLEQADARGQTFATQAGCTDQGAECLRALPVSTLLQFEPAIEGGSILTPLSPTVDGTVLPTTTAVAFASGHFNKVAVIEGSNSHEFSALSTFFIDSVLGREMNASEYPGYITQAFGPQASAVMTQYTLNDMQTAAWTYDDAATDFLFACSGHTAAKELAANGSAVFAYEFNDVNAPVTFPVAPPRPDGYGAYHGADIQYVFPAGQTIYYGTPFNAAQQALSSQMIDYWTQFARTGNPNTPGGPNWPAYSIDGDTYLSLTPGAIAPDTQFAKRHNCAFWNGS